MFMLQHIQVINLLVVELRYKLLYIKDMVKTGKNACSSHNIAIIN